MKFFKFCIACLCLLSLYSFKGEQVDNQNNMNTENKVIENIMSRRSIRKYKPEAVKRSVMDKILECGINAPSGMNKQSWEIRVLDNPATISKLKELMVKANPNTDAAAVEGCFRNAPTLVFVANDLSYDFSAIDCGLLSQNIMLSAWSLNVGSVCLGSPIRYIKNSPEALQMLGFTQGYEAIICIGLGYADESPEAKPRNKAKIKYIGDKVSNVKIISDKIKGDLRYVSATPTGVCSKQVDLVLKGDVIVEAKFHGGCDGNLKGICELIKGKKISEIKEQLQGITCGKKTTSCPDQLSLILEAL